MGGDSGTGDDAAPTDGDEGGHQASITDVRSMATGGFARVGKGEGGERV